MAWFETVEVCILCRSYSDELEDGLCLECFEGEAEEVIAEVEFDGEEDDLDVELQEVWL